QALPGQDEIAVVDGVFHDMATTLEASLRKERILLENAVDVICSIGSDFNFSSVSRAADRAWGYPLEEIMNHPFSNVIHEEDREEINRTVHAMVQGGRSGSFECRVARARENPVHTLWSAQYSGSEKSLYCVVHDITARKLAVDRIKASEARARQILESMPVGLLVLDPQGKIESSNALLTNLIGYEQSELAGRSLTALLAKTSAGSS